VRGANKKRCTRGKREDVISRETARSLLGDTHGKPTREKKTPLAVLLFEEENGPPRGMPLNGASVRDSAKNFSLLPSYDPQEEKREVTSSSLDKPLPGDSTAGNPSIS